LAQGDNAGNLTIEAPEPVRTDIAGQPVSPVRPTPRPNSSQIYGR